MRGKKTRRKRKKSPMFYTNAKGEPENAPISEETMSAAVKIEEFLSANAEAACKVMGRAKGAEGFLARSF